MRRVLSVVVLYLGVLALTYTAVSNGGGPAAVSPAPGTPAAAPAPDDIELVAALESFDGCDDLLSYFKREGLERVGAWGLTPPMYYGDVVMERADAMTGGGTAGGTAAAGAQARDSALAAPVDADVAKKAVSGTNVQEAGVDEPDRSKTDGQHLVAISQGKLHVFDVSTPQVRRLGSLRLRGAVDGELLLDGDRVLVLTRGDGGHGPHPAGGDALSSRAIMPEMMAPISTLTVVDISQPRKPTVTSSMTLDGNYVSARLIDGVARIVVRSDPTALAFVTPKGGGLRAERTATRHNREVIRRSSVDDWLPYSIITDAATGAETEQSVLECDAVHHPAEFGGFGMVTVLSVDLDDGLAVDGAAGVVGDADTVYAAPGNLYVALQQWEDPIAAEAGEIRPPRTSDGMDTTIHQFDIADPAAAEYVASGAVSGRLLNQWALSEHEGVLRVATTKDDVGRGRSASAVVALERQGTRLRQIGRVGGLGKGEQIYAVRYDGDIGYVVTFRQTDPLYTLDLADPRRPKVLGELKINGYSAYLHPVGDGRVAGVGQDATKTGRIKGSQVSLFDVSNLRRPDRLDQLFLGEGSSDVEFDHRAFLYWPETQTMVVPLQTWTRRPFNGVVVIDVEGDRLQRRGTLRHNERVVGADPQGQGLPQMPGGHMITRSFVVGDILLTVSDAGVLATDLEDLKSRGWAAFPR